jgi:hypothetical protein
LDVSPSVVSSALVREEAGVQKLVYFTSMTLHGVEEMYPQVEKLAFSLVVSARRLRLYFQAHVIGVLTEYPLRNFLQKPYLSRRLVNRAVELELFDIEIHPRTAIKGKALADFLVEFCNIPESKELPKESTWVVYVDGSSASKRSGVGVMLLNLEGQVFRFPVKSDFITTNNKSENEAVIAGLSISREVGAINIEIRRDFQLVVGQVKGEFDT